MSAKKTPCHVGDTFGTMRVIGVPVHTFIESSGRKLWLIPCVCKCGNRSNPQWNNLKHASGCVRCRNRKLVKSVTTHGVSKSKLHSVYFGMLGRCSNPKHISFKNYGARGIKVCMIWRRSFIVFQRWALANGYKQGLRIDRKNGDGNYTPSNCRWATAKEQARNTRRNHYIEAFGERKLMQDWLDDPRCKVARIALGYRLRAGWDAEAALTRPSYSRRR